MSEQLTFSWPAIRVHACKLFGDELPRAETESAILDVFQVMPQAVVRAIEDVGADFAAGRVRSGWAILRNRLVDAGKPARDVTATDTSEREAQIGLAESWITRTGCQVDRVSELVLELFGDRGRLRAWAQADSPKDERGRDLDGWEITGGDESLILRMVELWQAERPRGERCEAESLAWQERCRSQRAALDDADEPREQSPTVELDPDEAAEIEGRRELVLAALGTPGREDGEPA